jgi:hypothetical protein
VNSSRANPRPREPEVIYAEREHRLPTDRRRLLNEVADKSNRHDCDDHAFRAIHGMSYVEGDVRMQKRSRDTAARGVAMTMRR